MALLYQPLEITTPGVGMGTGKWRMVRYSDDDPAVSYRGLCEHEHDTPAEAQQCPDARAEIDRVFPSLKRRKRTGAAARAEDVLSMLDANNEDLCSITTQVNLTRVIQEAELAATEDAGVAYAKRLRTQLQHLIGEAQAERRATQPSPEHAILTARVSTLKGVRRMLLGDPE